MGVGVQKTLFCRKCILEVGCMAEGVGLDRECMEFVTACFFLFFFFFFFDFLREGILKIFPIIFLMLVNKTSSFTIYVAGWCFFFSLILFLSFFFFFLRVGGGEVLPTGQTLLCIFFLLCFSYLSLNIPVWRSLFLVI